jgi:hypothetical protein
VQLFPVLKRVQAQLQVSSGSVERHRKLLIMITSLLSLPAGQRHLFAVMRPGKVEDPSRLKIRHLLWRSTAEFLFPKIGDAVLSQYVLQSIAFRRPARVFS